MINTVILFKTELVWPTSFDKVATAEEVLVARENATDTLAMSSPVLIGSSW